MPEREPATTAAPPSASQAGTVRTPSPLHAVAYPRSWRVLAGILVAISRGSLPALLALVRFSHNPPIYGYMLMRGFTILVIAPAVAAWLIERALEVRVTVDGEALLLEGRDRSIELPATAMARIDPWLLPLPGNGIQLRLQSGRRFAYGLQIDDPTPLVNRLPASAGAQDALRHPSVIYAAARYARGPRAWYYPWLRFVVFALGPTVPLFRVHQIIAYGGTLGEYYLLGLSSYLRTFAEYWVSVTMYVMLYAGFLRGLVEFAALSAAWAAPSRAARVRRAAERADAVAYYGGVPVFVILRFLPW